MSETTTSALVAQENLNVFGSIQSFEDAQRMAKVFVNSSLVPQQFKGDLGSCLIALNMANRMKADPLQVMQNIYIVHGKPSLSSSYLIACFNQCGRYSAIRYKFEGEKGTDTWGCKAVATELATGEILEGVTVTMAMAKAEGWHNRAGSKWKTMPELMMRYRAATFLIRSVAPEIALGFTTTEEVRDVIDITNEAQIEGDAPNLKAIALQAVLEGEGAENKAQAQPRENEEQKATDVAEAQPEQPQPARERESEKAQDFTSRFFEQHKHQEQ